MKSLFFTIALALLAIGADDTEMSGNFQPEPNYIPYFLKAEKAKKLYKNGRYEESYKILDSLFDYYEPKNTLILNESYTFLTLCVTLGKTHNSEKVIKYFALKEGWEYTTFEEDQRVFMINNTSLDSIAVIKLNKLYKTEYIPALADSLAVMFERDQEVRQSPIDEDKLAKVRLLNNRQLIDIIKKYGFPTKSQVDDLRKVANISVMLKHLTPEEKLEVRPILYEELKKGKVAPWIYGSMLDKETRNNLDTEFPYYGTYSNMKPTDTTACNDARESIGLPRIKF
ncbi:MAG: hypothetical protein IE909_09085 [Campylobacterales bacterium]|nr:hypothetical protein [Campylobacterales bacterium]